MICRAIHLKTSLVLMICLSCFSLVSYSSGHTTIAFCNNTGNDDDTQTFLKGLLDLPTRPDPGEYPQLEQMTGNDLACRLASFARAQIQPAPVDSQKGNSFFIRKVLLPPDALVEFRADLHGDIHSFLSWLDTLHQQNWFESPLKLKSRRYLVLLGDYVDRGAYGAEVLSLITRLAEKNPGQVFVIRGNHEDVKINNQRDGFLNELHAKGYTPAENPDGKGLSRKVLDLFYKSLPVGIFLGVRHQDNVHYLLACHGAPAIQDGPVVRDFLTDNSVCSWLPEKSGWLWQWHDLAANSHIKKSDRSQRGHHEVKVLCQNDYLSFLKEASAKGHCITGIIRGHQHGTSDPIHPTLREQGIHVHWPETEEENSKKQQQNQITLAKGFALTLDGAPWIPGFDIKRKQQEAENTGILCLRDTTLQLQLHTDFQKWTASLTHSMVKRQTPLFFGVRIDRCSEASIRTWRDSAMNSDNEELSLEYEDDNESFLAESRGMFILKCSPDSTAEDNDDMFFSELGD